MKLRPSLSSLLQRLSRALSIAVEDIDVARLPHVYGVDSLLAVELRKLVHESVEGGCGLFLILRNKTVLLRWEVLLRENVV